MTEFEFRESLAALYGQVSQDSTMCFTLISAYLVVAYLVGARLTITQVIIVNTLSGFWAGMSIFAIHSELSSAAQLTVRFSEAGYLPSSNGDASNTGYIALAYPAVLFLGVIAAFYFMWSIRHPKTE